MYARNKGMAAYLTIVYVVQISDKQTEIWSWNYGLSKTAHFLD